MVSGLSECSGLLEPCWLQDVVTVDRFFASDVRHLLIRRHPQMRVLLESELAADRAVIEAAMHPGDELRQWVHWFFPKGPSGKMGVALVRDGAVVKAWCTGFLC
jgi:hypothetical protein